MTKRRMLAMIMALIAVCSVLSACTASGEESSKDQVNEETLYGSLVLIETNEIKNSTLDYSIVYDKETGVMYLFMDMGVGRGGLTVMYNADGTPKLYSPDTKTE